MEVLIGMGLATPEEHVVASKFADQLARETGGLQGNAQQEDAAVRAGNPMVMKTRAHARV